MRRGPSPWLLFNAIRRPGFRPPLVVILACLATTPSALSQSIPQDSFLAWMNSIAQQDLHQRAQVVRSIRTIGEAEQRRRFVRQQLLHDLGGFPDHRAPLNAKCTATIQAGSYTIEKVIYESLPGFYITANLYRPNEPGRYPAVLLHTGHTQEGKAGDQRIAANLAMKGFVALSFDPIGQGEREQTYSRQLDDALAGWSVPEHIELNAQSRLIGHGLARYFIWDAMRSLDYLSSRPDVDASRIGTSGCSGGGALAMFLGALDPRVKVVVSSCFPSSYQTLFPLPGAHAEMTFPHFLASDLDTADFLELAAPKPWLLQSNAADQYGFGPEGVELVYREAQDWYDLYGARGNLGLVITPGPHGMPLQSREALYRWMIQWMKNGQGDFHEQPVTMFPETSLLVTPSGHVEDLPGSRKLHQLFLKDLHARETSGSITDLLSEFKALQIPTGESGPRVKIRNSTNTPFGSRQQLEFESEPGIWIEAALYTPSSPGRHSAVVLVQHDEELKSMPPATLAEKLASIGQVVLLLEPRSSRFKNPEGPGTGDWFDDLHADLIGRNLPAMRAHDILRGVDLLSARPDVDPHAIRGAAQGVAGIWLLLAAASDPRLTTIWLDRTPSSLRAALDISMPARLPDAVIPGFILRWDLQDLVKAIEPRRVFWTDPVNWRQHVVALGPPFRYRYVVGEITDEKEAQDDAFIREFLK